MQKQSHCDMSAGNKEILRCYQLLNCSVMSIGVKAQVCLKLETKKPEFSLRCYQVTRVGAAPLKVKRVVTKLARFLLLAMLLCSLWDTMTERVCAVAARGNTQHTRHERKLPARAPHPERYKTLRANSISNCKAAW